MKVLSFYSDKGGVGKTLLNIQFANFLKNKNHSVLVVDTVKGLRGLSAALEAEDGESGNKLTDEQAQLYPEIIRIDSFDDLQYQAKNFKYDFVFFDLLGMSVDTLKYLMKCDYVFYITTKTDLNLDLRPYQALTNVSQKFAVKKVSFFFNKTSKTELMNLQKNKPLETFANTLENRDFYNSLKIRNFNFEDEMLDAFNEIYQSIT